MESCTQRNPNPIANNPLPLGRSSPITTVPSAINLQLSLSSTPHNRYNGGKLGMTMGTDIMKVDFWGADYTAKVESLG